MDDFDDWADNTDFLSTLGDGGDDYDFGADDNDGSRPEEEGNEGGDLSDTSAIKGSGVRGESEFTRASEFAGGGSKMQKASRTPYDAAMIQAGIVMESSVFQDIDQKSKTGIAILANIRNTKDVHIYNIELLAIAYLWKARGKELNAKTFKVFYEERKGKSLKASPIDLLRYIRRFG
jgi:hypothetical protein